MATPPTHLGHSLLKVLQSCTKTWSLTLEFIYHLSYHLNLYHLLTDHLPHLSILVPGPAPLRKDTPFWWAGQCLHPMVAHMILIMILVIVSEAVADLVPLCQVLKNTNRHMNSMTKIIFLQVHKEDQIVEVRQLWLKSMNLQAIQIRSHCSKHL